MNEFEMTRKVRCHKGAVEMFGRALFLPSCLIQMGEHVSVQRGVGVDVAFAFDVDGGEEGFVLG